MADRAFEHCMGFVAASEDYRAQYTDVWEEVMANAIVRLDDDAGHSSTSPYRRRDNVYSPNRRNIRLKDFETNKLMRTYVAQTARALLGDMHHEYVRTRPTGYEDWQEGRTTTKLIAYTFGLEGHFRTLVETLWDMCLFGTAITETSWRYEERSVLARSITPTPFGMQDTTERITIPTYDDPCIRAIDPMDFYPDPSRYRIYEMSGCAKRFRMNGFEAERMGVYDQAAVKRATAKGTGATSKVNNESFRRGLDQPMGDNIPPGFKEMIGYEYWGDVPNDVKLRDHENKKDVTGGRGVITVLNGEVVRRDLWPLADYCLPFDCAVINPMNGRFYGLSPAEIVRYSQSFADAVQILLAEAIIRNVHPPIAVDPDADIDIAKLKAWRADAIITARGGPNSVGTLKYGADINGGFMLLAGLKQGMQEGGGARGAIQGENGPDREAASVGVQRQQFAMDPMELVAMLLEQDWLPGMAKKFIRRYQQFIPDDADLQRRIGSDPGGTLNDIMGDFEVEFFGSRLTMNRQQKLQGMDRLTAMGQVFPAIGMVLPTIEISKEIVGDMMEMPQVAAMIGQNPQAMEANMLAMQMAGGKGPAQNGVPPAAEPAGMMPAQAQGY